MDGAHWERSIFPTWWRTSLWTVYALPRRPRSWHPARNTATGATRAAGHLPPRSGGAALRWAYAPAAQRPRLAVLGAFAPSPHWTLFNVGGPSPPNPPTCAFGASLDSVGTW